MKKEITYWYFLFCTIVVMTACSNSDDLISTADSQSGFVAFSVQFSEAQSQKASVAQSTAIPPTSWNNIKSLQFLLYDESGVVKYSDMLTSLPASINGKKEFSYDDVPVGKYTLVVVANVKTPSINTSIDGGRTATEWSVYNVRERNVSNLLLNYKPNVFPDFIKEQEEAVQNVAYTEPSEIFMGTASNSIVVTAGQKTVLASPITLVREVSLMRVRLNVMDTESGVVNTNTTNGVDFSKNVSLMITRLPKNMGVKAGNEGGVSSTSDINSVLSISGENVFNLANPLSSSGYNPTTVLTGNFTMWRDLIVFPNNGGRINNSLVYSEADKDSQYYIMISALGKSGHVLSNGTKLSTDTTIYWSGIIKDNFVPNVIREVNMTLKSGGDAIAPVTPREEGGLEIKLSIPQAWDSNVIISEIII